MKGAAQIGADRTLAGMGGYSGMQSGASIRGCDREAGRSRWRQASHTRATTHKDAVIQVPSAVAISLTMAAAAAAGSAAWVMGRPTTR